MIDINKLKEKAQAANSGWPSNSAEREFRTVATTAAVLELIALVERQEAELAEFRKEQCAAPYERKPAMSMFATMGDYGEALIKWKASTAQPAKAEAPQIVPDGWKLVPIQPTHEMIRASCDAMGATLAVKAAIKAAPMPPIIGAMRFDAARLNELILAATNAAYDCGEWQEESTSDPLHLLVKRSDDAKAELIRYITSSYSPATPAPAMGEELPPLHDFRTDMEYARLLDALQEAINDYGTRGATGSTQPWASAMCEVNKYIREHMIAYGRACMALHQPASDQIGDIFDLIREWAHLPEGQRGDAARKIIGSVNKSYMAGVKDTRALIAASTAPAQPVAAQDIEDPIVVPRGLLGAACHAISRKKDAPEVLSRLRSFTTGDRSAPPAPVAAPAGWKLVPIKPTDAMKTCTIPWFDNAHMCGLIYAAMLTAAPAPEGQP